MAGQAGRCGRVPPGWRFPRGAPGRVGLGKELERCTQHMGIRCPVLGTAPGFPGQSWNEADDSSGAQDSYPCQWPTPPPPSQRISLVPESRLLYAGVPALPRSWAPFVHLSNFWFSSLLSSHAKAHPSRCQHGALQLHPCKCSQAGGAHQWPCSHFPQISPLKLEPRPNLCTAGHTSGVRLHGLAQSLLLAQLWSDLPSPLAPLFPLGSSCWGPCGRNQAGNWVESGVRFKCKVSARPQLFSVTDLDQLLTYPELGCVRFRQKW